MRFVIIRAAGETCYAAAVDNRPTGRDQARRLRLVALLGALLEALPAARHLMIRLNSLGEYR